MTATFWIDLYSLLLSMRFAIAAPRVLRSFRRDAADFMAAYDEVVLPIVDELVCDLAIRKRLGESLRSYTVKACFIVNAYTRMAGISFMVRLAVFGLSFTRLYDDLLDEYGDQDLEKRLGQLFQSGVFLPRNDLERVLCRFYENIVALLERKPDDPVFGAIRAVHEYQVLSRKQRDTVAPDALLEITRGKGGYAIVAIFGLMRESMSAAETGLLLQFGEAVQFLDDYQDIELDRQNGVHTVVTEGICGLPDVREILQRLYPQLRMFYGRRGTESFLAVFFLTMCLSFLRRHWPALGTSPRAIRRGSAVNVLLVPGDNLMQEARARARRSRGS
jgi:hypothetical protein